MVGASIKNYLDDNGIKYSYIAEKIGIPANTFSTILNDKREIKVTEYFDICEALGVPLEKFAPTSKRTQE